MTVPVTIDGKHFESKMAGADYMFSRAEGATRAEVQTALGWPKVNLEEIAKKFGKKPVKLPATNGSDLTRYRFVVLDQQEEEAPQATDAADGGLVEFFDKISDGNPVFLTALSNNRGGGGVRWELVSSAMAAATFIERHDRPGMGIYFAAARLKDGATRRCADAVKEAVGLWADVDFKDHPTISAVEIDRRLKGMSYPPTIIVDSGHGRHCYWLFNEPFDLQDANAKQEFEEALKLVARHVGGDTSVCEVARLMRLPGSHNTKDTK